ncbi:MAG: NAD-dependent DNA ligase LigA [Firmicutes bacterium]|nr:NAD-dependent DNA ligase LigA [Bacillota bacterium]
MEDKAGKIKELVKELNRARRTYEQEDREIMSNFEYDRLYDQLKALEEETGIVLASSPTVNVGYDVVSQLPKEEHPSPMLSLDKTKDPQDLKAWLGDKEGLLSWKLDGLTVVLTYDDGNLSKAVTRGNGTIGEVITANARTFENLPLSIPFKGHLVLRGEAVIRYSDFERINGTIPEAEAKYKNPRNLCSGSVRQLDSSITAGRSVRFCAFALVNAGDAGDMADTREEQLKWLADQGFETVAYRRVNGGNVEDTVKWFAERVADNDIPSDGLVLTYDDIEYGRSLGTTAKFPRDSIAFKWEDELMTTRLLYIEWSASRTGQINPIAVFEPVELEGTTVSRASVHNVSILKELKLGEGDEITVYKANMIIPQIAENLTKSDTVKIPDVCPVCGNRTVLRQDEQAQVLFCPNEKCLAKQIKSLTHFVSRNAMDIEGISEATIEKFVDLGYIGQLADIFRISKYRDRIVEMEGFGEKSYENLIDSVEKARKTSPARFLYSLGISGIGAANAKLIAKAAGGDWDRMQNLTVEELTSIEGIGQVMAENYTAFFSDPENTDKVGQLLNEIEFETEQTEVSDQLAGKTFVITGSLNHFDNRDALKEYIESLGGKTSGSVSGKTSYLINNDINSGSSKNKKAKELGVEIITEETFMEMVKGGSDA